MKARITVAGIIAALVGIACSPPPPPSPYVASACPLPAGVHGYPIAAHDPAGTLDTGTLSVIARAVGRHMAISHQQGDSLPDDLMEVSARLWRDQPLERGDWRPSPTDTATLFVNYHAGDSTPVFTLASTQSESGEFAKRVLHAATVARDHALAGRPQTDTLPLYLHLTHGGSAVVLLRFGSEPGPTDGVAHFTAHERGIEPSPSNRSPAYPEALRSVNMNGEVVLAFVVGTDSAADMSTVAVVRSTDPLFTKSVLQSLPHFRYTSMELDCRLVSVLAQQPFIFRLGQ